VVTAGLDVFLNVGAPMPDPTLITPPIPRTATSIQARVEFDAIARSQPVDIAIAAGVRETLTALIEAVRSLASAERLSALAGPRLQAARDAAAAAEAKRRQGAEKHWNASPMSWERVAAELDQALEPNAIVVPELGNRTPLYWLDLAPGRKQVIGQTTGFALGWAVGAAIGVKIAQPDREVACIVGDGAMLFGQIESLWTASRYHVPVLIVVMNNRSYDAERNRIQAGSPVWRNQETRAQWRDVAGYLGDPEVDFVSLARGFAIDGATCATPAELRKALRRAKRVLAEGRPFVIDALLMQLASNLEPTEQKWHPDISIAAERTLKV
jgi:thiamine pyrophosphate-dependent acetolactate synthase large subunit-like protein